MRTIDLDSITTAPVVSCAKDVQLTHDEWHAANGLLRRASAMSNDTRSEFSLLSEASEPFDAEDPYLDRDAVFGVHETLPGSCERINDAVARARLGLPSTQCLVMTVELRLVPEPEPSATT
jgi:hypothetical protein